MIRNVRAHRKSRQGCGNCKLRKVKCDEGKPKCRRCREFGVLCDYDCRHFNLQLSADGPSTIVILPKSSNPLNRLNQTIPHMIAPSLRQQLKVSLGNNISYQLREEDLELLCLFQVRTVSTVSTGEGLRIYQNEMIKLASSHPFLMHTVLTLTIMHDRSLSAVNAQLSTTEAFHWFRSLALFNSKLSGPIQSSERDALWATSILLGIISICSIDARTPEEAWPLRPPSSLDLNWLKISVGKQEVWRISQPLRPDSSFCLMILENKKFLPNSAIRPKLEALPSGFIDLYAFDAMSTNDNNPYYGVASALAHVLGSDRIQLIILNFLYFIYGMRPDYKRLLEQKDPRALLLLAYWYAKVCQYQLWWAWRRASLECQAICMYLESYHRRDTDILTLLQFPKMALGLVST